MTKTATKKKRLDKNTKYVALGIVAGGAVLVLAIAVPVTIILSNQRKTDDFVPPENKIPDLKTVMDQTDELERMDLKMMGLATWKWEALNARRPFSNTDPKTNGGVALQTFSNRLPAAPADYFDQLQKALPAQLPNVRLNATQVGELQALLGPHNSLLADIHAAPKQGAYWIQMRKETKNQEGKTVWVERHPYEIEKPHLIAIQKMSLMVCAEGVLRLDAGDLGGADQCFHTLMRMAGFYRTEPFAESQIERMRIQLLAVELLERILAQSPAVPEELLKPYQDKLQYEVHYNEFLEAVRAERGMFTKLSEMGGGWAPPYKVLKLGPQDGEPEEGGGGAGMPGMENPGSTPPMPGMPAPGGGMPGMPGGGMPGMPGSGGGGGGESKDMGHAWFLQYMNELVKIAKNTPTGKVNAIRQWNKETPRAPSGAQGFVPECDQWMELYLKKTARMAPAALAIAIERHKVYYGKMPSTFNDLKLLKDPEDKTSYIMNYFPKDPYTGQDLIFRQGKNNEGWVVYSVGEDNTDNFGLFEALNTYQPSTDVGFRLWNANKRKQ